jgi:Na+/glutamate symporter
VVDTCTVVAASVSGGEDVSGAAATVGTVVVVVAGSIVSGVVVEASVDRPGEVDASSTDSPDPSCVDDEHAASSATTATATKAVDGEHHSGTRAHDSDAVLIDSPPYSAVTQVTRWKSTIT